jgi:2-oxo-4-hydroxy-4-carboxy-5-ureidoimidazoline decarboxylase
MASPRRADLAACCGSTRWIDGMMARQPFDSLHALLSAARDVWNALEPDDWKEAFRHHPKIGDGAKLEDLPRREQAGMTGASAGVLNALAEANRAYEARFGYIFIVCATGKSADEMLAIVRERLRNDPETEIHIAAGEQAKITEL